MKLDINEIMRKAKIELEQNECWVVTINGYDEYDNELTRSDNYDDEWFEKEGLPAALVASRLANKKFDDYLISEVYSEDSSWVIPSRLYIFSSQSAQVTKGKQKYDLNLISDEDAKEIIRNFLTTDIFYEGESDEEFIEKVLNEIFPKLRNVKVKK